MQQPVEPNVNLFGIVSSVLLGTAWLSCGRWRRGQLLRNVLCKHPPCQCRGGTTPRAFHTPVRDFFTLWVFWVFQS